MTKNYIWCGSTVENKIPAADFEKKFSFFKRTGCIVPVRKNLKSKADIDAIRESGKINTEALDYVTEFMKDGISTEEINGLIHKRTTELGAIPAPLNYNGFPKSICTSINDQVCHGIPSSKDILKNGDIVNVDVSTVYKDYFSDSSRTFCIGEIGEDKKKLVETAKECVLKGLEMVMPWNFMGDMANAVQKYAYANGYSVVEMFGGHGIGWQFHEDPFVAHVGNPKTGMVLVPGMVFTIEPMINMGKKEVFIDKINDWTVYTADGLPSAQWEVTVAVTDTGYEILAY